MILIKKNAEPNGWIEYRRLTPGADFSPTTELRDTLYAEQGYICAYCMRRIPVRDVLNRGRNGELEKTNEDHRIEHILCQESHQDRRLDYKNLVICCPGHINGVDHCDRAKKNRDISLSPLDESFIKKIAYGADGAIKSSVETYDKEMDEVLNLNDELLKKNRKSSWMGVLEQLRRKGVTKGMVKKQLEYYQNMHSHIIDGKEVMAYEPYCGIVIYHLQKILKRL
jgi:uncharacterized protein (TIGR02646 family)